jgi:hypothetical protein
LTVLGFEQCNKKNKTGCEVFSSLLPLTDPGSVSFILLLLFVFKALVFNKLICDNQVVVAGAGATVILKARRLSVFLTR